MSIVKMRHFELLGLEADCKTILGLLQRAGCVQVDEPEKPEDFSELQRRRSGELQQTCADLATLKSAIDSLVRFSEKKRSIFTPRPLVGAKRFFDEQKLVEALETAEELCMQSKKITALNAEEGRLQNRMATLQPWSALDIPLNTPPLRSLNIVFGVIPAAASLDELDRTLAGEAELAEVFLSSIDSDQQYLCVMYHPAVEETVTGVLKSFAFGRMAFKDVDGTAEENLLLLRKRLEELRQERESIQKGISDYASVREDLELACDHLGVTAAREEAAELLLSTGKTFYLKGWIPAPAVEPLQKALSAHDCALAFEEPGEEDEPPILLRNNSFTRPFMMVSKMYAMPMYRNTDPNPLISVFYALFFGMMFADVAYGLILIAISLFVTKKLKPKGPMVRYMFPLMGLCGGASILWGVIFGSFFSDIIEVVAKTYFGAPADFLLQGGVWKLVDPMVHPEYVLIVAVVLGVIHLLFGMGVKAYLLCRDKKPLDALFDVGSWWLLFAGFAVLALGGTFWVMVAGFAALILTQGRRSKSIGGKLGMGLVSLYDLTGYLSDVLSYSRLMALGLTGGVLGSVFNIIGSMMGGANIVFGTLGFIAIFLVGHVLNFGINIIGTYVHAARLQYVEFYNKFYESGGKEFAPLNLTTKYVDIEGVDY